MSFSGLKDRLVINSHSVPPLPSHCFSTHSKVGQTRHTDAEIRGPRLLTIFRQTLDHFDSRLESGFMHGLRVRHLQQPAPAAAPRAVGWDQAAAAAAGAAAQPASPGVCIKLEHRAQPRISTPQGRRRPAGAAGQVPSARPLQATWTEVTRLPPSPQGVTRPRAHPATST